MGGARSHSQTKLFNPPIPRIAMPVTPQTGDQRKLHVVRRAGLALQALSLAAEEAEGMVDQALADDLNSLRWRLNEVLRAAERRRYHSPPSAPS